MATDMQAFVGCVAALDKLTKLFRDMQLSVAEMTPYESDRSAFQLMEFVFRHVNAVSHLAMAPAPGANLYSALPLLRSAFEIAVVVLWLVVDNSWEERESRWLGWVAGEEEYLSKFAKGIGETKAGVSEVAMETERVLRERRLSIEEKLPIAARSSRPRFHILLQECDIPPRQYEAYRIMSHLTHGGPGLCREVWEASDSLVRMRAVNLGRWSEWFRIAGWSITAGGQASLLRLGVDRARVHAFVDAHDELLAACDMLQQFDTDVSGGSASDEMPSTNR
jgi:hypothetical protein